MASPDAGLLSNESRDLAKLFGIDVAVSVEIEHSEGNFKMTSGGCKRDKNLKIPNPEISTKFIVTKKFQLTGKYGQQKYVIGKCNEAGTAEFVKNTVLVELQLQFRLNVLKGWIIILHQSVKLLDWLEDRFPDFLIIVFFFTHLGIHSFVLIQSEPWRNYIENITKGNSRGLCDDKMTKRINACERITVERWIMDKSLNSHRGLNQPQPFLDLLEYFF